MRAAVPGGHLMRVLTVEDIRPTLDEWQALGSISASSPLASILPFTHFNPVFLDTFLDHMALSRTLSEVFDHPVEVTTKDGKHDLSPGISIARPLIPESDYLKITDHLPVILVLRTSVSSPVPPPPSAVLVIAAAIPNPIGNDTEKEEVHLKNTGTTTISLAGWKIGDAAGTDFWNLDTTDGSVEPESIKKVLRRSRSMFLDNTGDTIRLINPSGNVVDTRSYGSVSSGQLLVFN